MSSHVGQPPPPKREPTAGLPQESLAAQRQPDTTRFVAWLVICASAVMVMWNLQKSSKKNSNTGSRYATVESLVDHGTYSINRSGYRFTIDKVKIGKRYYSSKPPTLPTYAAGVYYVYQKVTGHRIKTHEGQVLWVVGMATGWLSHVVLLLYFFRLSRRLFQRQLAQLGALIALAFGSLSTAYATTLNNHSVGACLLFACFAHAVMARERGGGRGHWVAAGLYGGFLPAVDLPSGLMSALVGLLLLVSNWRWTLCYYVPALVPGVATSLTLSYVSTGSTLPVYLRKELYRYPGSYWAATRGVDALREPKHVYLFHVLFGHHGLFSMTPLYALSLLAIARRVSLVHLRRRAPRALEAALCVVLLVGLVGFYGYRSHNYGGWCVGMRWLVPLMPLLMLYFGAWLDDVGPGAGRALLVAAAFGVSSYHVQDGLSGPFQFSRWHNWIDGTPNRNRTAAKLNLGKAAKASTKRKRRRRKRPQPKNVAPRPGQPSTAGGTPKPARSRQPAVGRKPTKRP